MSENTLTPANNPQSAAFWPVVLGLAGVLLALVVYGVLPAVGLDGLGGLLSDKLLVLLLGLGVGAIAYGIYLDLVLDRPHWLVGFVLFAWPLVELLNEWLLMQAGVNLHLRPLLMLSVAVPCLWFTVRNLNFVLKAAPHFKYLGVFWVWLLLYFVFNNANASDPRWMSENVWSEGSVALVQMTSYTYILLIVGLTAVTVFTRREAQPWFDTLNKALLVVMSLQSLATIAGYPFGVFSMELDGFRRAMGIFTHPNPFAHHMGLLMIYLLGLFCYYQGPMRARMPGWLLGGGILINGAAFLLGLSKTALGVFALCAVLLYLLNLSSPIIRRSFIKPLLLGLLLLPVVLFVFQLVTGQSFFDLVAERVEKTQSLDWRMIVWNGLMEQIQGVHVWGGHGFTAANAAVFQMTYNNATNAQPLMMVHNGYIALLYDLGIMGWTYFLAVLALMGNCVIHLLVPGQRANRPLLACVLALSAYFLLSCAFDEMTYMFDAPQFYWLLVTMLFCLVLRESPLIKREGED